MKPHSVTDELGILFNGGLLGFHLPLHPSTILSLAALMEIWDSAPADILMEIARKLTLTEQRPFAGACRYWRSVVSEYRRSAVRSDTPYLVIPGSDGTRSPNRRLLAYPMDKNIDQEMDLPLLSIPGEDVCCGACHGWLAMVTNEMTMYLKNPFSGARIDLPSLYQLGLPEPHMAQWHISKAILSARPDEPRRRSDCKVVIFFGPFSKLAFCRTGDAFWQVVESPIAMFFSDGIFFRDWLFTVREGGEVVAANLWGSQPRLAIFGKPPPPFSTSQSAKMYLVLLHGELLLISRSFSFNVCLEGHVNYCPDNGVRPYKATHFKVVKLEMGGKETNWVEVKDLNGGAAFIGINRSFAVSNSALVKGYKGDRIYFTDDYTEGHWLFDESGHDLGVFDLKNCIFERLCFTNLESMKPPAVWITPMPWVIVLHFLTGGGGYCWSCFKYSASASAYSFLAIFGSFLKTAIPWTSCLHQ